MPSKANFRTTFMSICSQSTALRNNNNLRNKNKNQHNLSLNENVQTQTYRSLSRVDFDDVNRRLEADSLSNDVDAADVEDVDDDDDDDDDDCVFVVVVVVVVVVDD
jgi:hypothetical protein